MENQNVLELLNQLENCNITISQFKEKILLDIENEMRLKTIKKSNNSTMIKAIDKYIKDTPKVSSRSELEGIKKTFSGWELINGFTGFILNSELDLSVCKSHEGEQFPELKNIITNEYDNIELDNIYIVKCKICIELMKSRKHKTPVDNINMDEFYNIGEKYFNPLYVLEAYNILGGIDTTTSKDLSPHIGIVVKSKNGKGIILPIRINNK